MDGSESGMKFRVLGPLAVLDRDGPVRLSGIKQRAALGYLLLHPNDVVATSTLLAALWTGRPPPTARKMLQNAISGLRGLLPGGGSARGPMLLTHAPGYLLRVHTDDLDLTAYEAMVKAGRAQLAAGSWPAGAKHLRAALDLWRGPVLADLTAAGTDWPELTAIQQARLTAQEDAVEADLACGRHHEVVRELQTLVETEPLRERLCAVLMLSLYRCGRQVDALEVYRRTRTELAEQLGLEPGRGLRDMERAILEHDPVLFRPDALSILARTDEATREGTSAGLSMSSGAVARPPAPLSISPAMVSPPPDALARAPLSISPAAVSPPPDALARPRATNSRPAAEPWATQAPAASGTAGTGLTEQHKQLSMLLVRAKAGEAPRGAGPQDSFPPSSGLTATIREEIERHGGKVSGVLGPVTFALFGVPRTREDDAVRAVQAGLALRERLGARGPGASGPGRGTAPLVQVAVATGDVLVTCAADGSGAIPVVSGSVPESCMELLETVPPGGIRVCSATRTSSERAIAYEPGRAQGKKPGKVPGKQPGNEPGGGSEPVAVRAEHPPSDALVPLVERGREVEQLRGLLGDVWRRRRPHFLTVLGEPGMGKSRLASELALLAAHAPEGFAVLTGHSSWADQGAPLSALAPIVSAAAGVEPGDSAAVRDEKLARTVHGLFGTGETGTWIAARLCALLRPPGVAPPSDLVAASEAARRFLAEIAAQRPLLVVFDDVHRAGEPLLDFIESLADTAGPVPMFVAVTARPELLDVRPGWGGGKRDALTLTLDPLSTSGTATLVAALLARDGTTLSGAPLEDLVARIGGNPLFAVEYVRTLREQSPPGSSVPPVPHHVHRVLASWVDTLPPDAKAVLFNASALNDVFCAEDIAAVGYGSQDQAARWLDHLEKRDFLRRSRYGSASGEAQYAFRYATTRSVVDALMSRPVREDHRRRAAARSGPAADLTA
ncbi:BTAD domain-containing putative transcriptional regulator [Streptomyces coffeae]|uniref:AAA family ATPase n=1 Tax=Streptomyces coffeae TaxID=621382 RepID=A0ABS1NRS4_9ACTN|nr:BTAD domain-containing putative transcriptional regulator [Streptomyces coffeae]MBL1102644.1 AAA family ATPase [Streptomyces coffeae]